MEATPRTEVPSGRIIVDPPPPLAPREGVGSVLSSAVPMLGSLGSVALVATMAGQGAGGHRSVLAAAFFLLGTLGFVVVQVDRQLARRRQEADRARRAYLRHLADVRSRARSAAAQQRRALRWHHPPPVALPLVAADGGRVAERTGSHPHVHRLRYGEASLALAVDLVPGGPEPVDDPDPVAIHALRRLLATHGFAPRLPVLLDLDETRVVEVSGAPGQARALLRAVVCQAATFHPPSEVVVAVLAGEERLPEWEWLKWLPHAHTPDDHPGARLLLVVDGHDRPVEHAAVTGRRDVTRLELVGDHAGVPPDTHTLRMVLETGSDGPTLRVLRRDAEPVTAVPDLCDAATAEALARRLLRHRRHPTPTSPAQDPLAGLVAADHAGERPPAGWDWRPPHAWLRVPIGTDDDGATVHLDLKEAAEQGSGPHGLVVGATGSGKSELLRSVVLGLAATHPPQLLNLALVDFKGGATFAGLADLPHVAAVVTNLADDLAMVDRMQDALTGEVVRRQELLHASGGFASARDHERARRRGLDLPPLPSLLVVVDEFSELLAARPEFLEVFTAVGRLGRSLGIHLLLASQRLEEGRLRGLESHLSYRVALRTFTTSESRAVLGVPDAAELPPEPGTGYLRTGPARLLRFRAAYVSGPATATVRRTGDAVVRPFTLAGLPAPPAEAPAAGSPSVLDVAVARLARHGPRARQVWLPPLDRPERLGDLLEQLPRRFLVLPVGTVDRPRDQRRDPLVVDLSGAGGHVAVVGGPRSGRTTALQTLALALAVTGSPRETQLFALDLAGGGLAPLGGLAHVSGVATNGEPDVVGRVVAEVRQLLDRREAWFRTHDVDVAAYRRRLRDGGSGDGHGEVFLLVDGWAALRTDHDDLEPELHRIAERGLALGVHLVVAANRWSDLRPRTRDLFGTRLELRLGDPLDSEVDRRQARLVPVGRPGRGLTADGAHVLLALPRLSDADDLTTAVARVAKRWPGKAAPRLRVLPDLVTLDDLHAHGAAASQPLLGLDDRLEPVALSLHGDPHLLVLGGRGSGRTATLRTLLREVIRTRSPEQAQVVLVDPRRSLLDEVPASHLLAHHFSTAPAVPAVAELAAHLGRRLPGPDLTTAQLRNRSWWNGAEVFVVVDDHELDAGPTSPLAALVGLLPRAEDVGLHLVVSRSTGGAARAFHEPVLQGLRDLASPTVLLPGSPDDGPVVGRLSPRPGPPGRGRLVQRDGGVRTVQVAWAPPAG